jgi:hypothetical protein
MGVLEDAALAYQQAVAAVTAPMADWSGMSKTTGASRAWAVKYAEEVYAATWRNVEGKSNFSYGAAASGNNNLNPDGTSKYAEIRQPDGSYAPPTPAQGGLSPTFATNPNTQMLGDPYYAKAEEQARYRGEMIQTDVYGVLKPNPATYNPNNYAPIQSVYSLSQPTPGNISSRTNVASNIQTILDPKTGLYSDNPNYRPAYNPTTQPYGGSAFNIATDMAGRGTVDPRVMGIANYQGFGEYRNGAPVPRASVGGGGGTSYDMAMLLEASGGQIGAELLQKAKDQGYVPSNERPLKVVESKSTISIWDLSSGMAGKNVPMGWVPPDNLTFMPMGALAAQQREGTKITYSPGGGFNVNQLIPSTQEGFTRIYPMITGGGSDYALQSGMVAGKALTPQVYDQYGLNALWTPDKASLIAEMQAHPERFSRQGAELYGGKVERLDNRTMQDQFTKGTVSTMPGRYAPESMNYAMLPGLLSPNTAKQFTGTDKLPSGASLTFASDPIFQMVDAKTGEIKGVTPNWEPVKQNIVPREQPEFIMSRPADVARVYTPEQPVQVQKYQPQIGGFIINAPPSFNMTQEVAEKKAYDANAAMMWADRQNKETFKSQTWMEPQPWQLVKNPLYQTPEQKAGAAPVAFMGMNVVSLEKAQPSGLPPTQPPTQAAANEFDSSRGIVAGFLPTVTQEQATAFATANAGKPSYQVAYEMAAGGINYDVSLLKGVLSQGTFGLSAAVLPPETYMVTPGTPERTVVTQSGGNETISKMGDWLTTSSIALTAEQKSLDLYNIPAVEAYNAKTAEYNTVRGTYLAMDAQNPSMITTTVFPATPEVRKNQWELYVKDSGEVARAAVGVDMNYLNAREEVVKNQPGLAGDFARLQYGAEKYMLTEPANLSPAALQGVAIVYGGGVLGAGARSVAAGGGMFAPIATALVSPTGQLLTKVGVGTFFGAGYAIDVTEKFTASKEKIEMNVGSTLPPLVAMYGGAGGFNWLENPRPALQTVESMFPNIQQRPVAGQPVVNAGIQTLAEKKVADILRTASDTYAIDISRAPEPKSAPARMYTEWLENKMQAEIKNKPEAKQPYQPFAVASPETYKPIATTGRMQMTSTESGMLMEPLTMNKPIATIDMRPTFDLTKILMDVKTMEPSNLGGRSLTMAERVGLQTKADMSTRNFAANRVFAQEQLATLRANQLEQKIQLHASSLREAYANVFSNQLPEKAISQNSLLMAYNDVFSNQLPEKASAASYQQKPSDVAYHKSITDEHMPPVPKSTPLERKTSIFEEYMRPAPRSTPEIKPENKPLYYESPPLKQTPESRSTVQPLFVSRPPPQTTEQSRQQIIPVYQTPEPRQQIVPRATQTPVVPVVPVVVPIVPKIPPLWGGSGGGSFGGAKPQGRARVTDIFRYGQGIGSFGSVTPINFGAPRGRKK